MCAPSPLLRIWVSRTAASVPRKRKTMLSDVLRRFLFFARARSRGQLNPVSTRLFRAIKRFVGEVHHGFRGRMSGVGLRDSDTDCDSQFSATGLHPRPCL